MKTHDEVRAFLAEKFSREKKRLKTFGTKANSFDYAHVITRYVLALMADSRNREIKRSLKFVAAHGRCDPRVELEPYLQERLKSTSVMSKAIENMAKDDEANRPWKSKAEQKQDKKDKKDKKRKHRRRHK